MSTDNETEDKHDDNVQQVLAVIREQTRKRQDRIKEKEEARLRYPEFEALKDRVARTLNPIKPADQQSAAPNDMLFVAKRSAASKHLPEPYLVYFLFVDLLDYTDLGPFEKLAYSIPIDFNGTAYLVEHRKFGVGVFASDLENQEADAARIVQRICNGVKAAQSFFEHLANEAGDGSRLNLQNHSRDLYDRFVFLRKQFEEKTEEAELRKEERVVETGVTERGGQWQTIWMPGYELQRESKWLGLSAIEAFFSWTEHVLIHLAVLQGTCTTGREVNQLTGSDWSTKVKAALDIKARDVRYLYSEMMIIRRQIRNYVAHGAFGKDGEAFYFHSGAGAVPLCLPHRRKRASFRFGFGADLDPTQAFDAISRFEAILWEGPRSGAKLYIQDYELPTILSMAADGTYGRAMSSQQAMVEFTEQLARRLDNARNMDW